MGIIGTFEGSASSQLDLYKYDGYSYTGYNGWLDVPLKVTEGGSSGNVDYEYNPITTWIYSSSTNWKNGLYRISNGIILTPYSTVHLKITSFPCNYDGNNVRGGNPASIKRIGIGSGSVTGNNFNVALDVANDIQQGDYTMNISGLNGTYYFYIYLEYNYQGGSRFTAGSKIVIYESYLTT